MSKSIYDEALEIIDNNTFELGKGLDVLKPTYRETVVKAIEQAQKQETELKQLQQDILIIISSLSKRKIILNPFDNVELEAFKRIDALAIKLGFKRELEK